MPEFIRPSRRLRFVAPLFLSLLLASCGGGGGGECSVSSFGGSASLVGEAELAAIAGAPGKVCETDTDGLNWFNFRRAQLGLSTLARNSKIELAAQRHSSYQARNDIITHEQDEDDPGFTGELLQDRLNQAGYVFINGGIISEVISATSRASGFEAAESLITAIYHRFSIFEPRYELAGAGSAKGGGRTYFTVDLVADGLNTGLGPNGFVVYPFANQTGIQTTFNSDEEEPDPVPGVGQNEVGFPISVHANVDSPVVVTSFDVEVLGSGVPLAVVPLNSTTDPFNTPDSAAAIIPLAPLLPGTTYEVSFVGTVDGMNVSRTWTFTTR